MKPVAATICAFFACTFTGMAGWESDVVPTQCGVGGDRYVLIYRAGHPAGSFESAVDDLATSSPLEKLQTLTIHALVGEQNFQQEVFDQLRENFPEALEAAQASAGNMHNPKMIALHSAFAESVMATPTVIGLNRVLEKHRMSIVRPSFEKLELRRNAQSKTFRCALWLKVAPRSATRSESKPEGSDHP